MQWALMTCQQILMAHTPMMMVLGTPMWTPRQTMTRQVVIHPASNAAGDASFRTTVLRHQVVVATAVVEVDVAVHDVVGHPPRVKQVTTATTISSAQWSKATMMTLPLPTQSSSRTTMMGATTMPQRHPPPHADADDVSATVAPQPVGMRHHHPRSGGSGVTTNPRNGSPAFASSLPQTPRLRVVTTSAVRALVKTGAQRNTTTMMESLTSTATMWTQVMMPWHRGETRRRRR